MSDSKWTASTTQPPPSKRLCTGRDAVVVGGGNSAGQAAVYLSGYTNHVHILIRGPEIAATTSEYLVQRIHSSRHITLHTNTEVVALAGDQHLNEVTWRNHITLQQETKNIGNIFVMIGADPSMQWLGGCVELDSNGFVVTGGGDLTDDRGPYRTSMPGIFVRTTAEAGVKARYKDSSFADSKVFVNENKAAGY